MTKYSVQYLTTASTVLTVEADDPEQAREVADEGFEPPFLCAQCSGWGNDQNLELGEFEQDDTEGGVWSA
jgi:hypothetical protein